jgi:hypothetical protein
MYDVDSRDADGDSALKIASQSGNEEMLEWLVENGANPFQLNNNYFTPLRAAYKSRQERCIKVLWKHLKLDGLLAQVLAFERVAMETSFIVQGQSDRGRKEADEYLATLKRIGESE